MITRTEEELAGSVSVAAAVTNPLNLVVDRRANRVLTFDAGTQELVTVKLASNGTPDPAAIGRFDARALGLQEPRGLTMDPASGRLYLLDSSGQRIVRVDPAPDQGLDMTEALNDGRVSTIDLRPADVVGAQGLAFNPADGHLYVLSPTKQALYEVTQTGQVVAVRDLADSDDFALIDPAGMVFAPSGDSTDDPPIRACTSSPVAWVTRGGGPARSWNCRWSRLRLRQLPLDGRATLVHTTFTSQWSSPSGLPWAALYIPTSGRLMISDSEIEEYQRPYWEAKRLLIHASRSISPARPGHHQLHERADRHRFQPDQQPSVHLG
jgi:DNA-binding beta-propeller fold protein YncE